jgi:hypothetical protein
MLKSLVMTHYRLGFTHVLVYIDFALFMLILADFAAYRHMNLSVVSAITNSTLPQPYQMFLPLLAFVLFLTLVLPSIIGLAKVAGVPGFADVNPASRPGLVLLSHLCFSLLFVIVALTLVRMEMLSGWQQVDDEFTTQFHSAFRGLVTSSLFIKVISALGSVTGLALSALAGYLLIGKEVAKPVRQYAARAMLANLPGKFRPVIAKTRGGLDHLEANGRIPAIRAQNQKMASTYYSDSLTRSERNTYASVLLGECDRLIRECLFEDPINRTDGATAKVEGLDIYDDLDNAWEAALWKAPKSEVVLVGPYTSPTVAATISRCCGKGVAVVKKVTINPNHSYRSWREQEDAIMAEMTGLQITAKTVTLVISHVSYATGLTTPMSQLVSRARDALRADLLYIIVDGTNAAGNKHKIPVDGEWDAYVFYPHRWLLASERCAITLTRKASAPDTGPHGSLGDGRARYDDAFRVIAGLRAGLEVIRTTDIEYFWERCARLREAFISGLPRSFQILGSQTGMEPTFILGCYPTEGNSWRPSVGDMNDAVGKLCSSASMISIDQARPWLRVSLPYYLDPRELNTLNNFLAENVAN